MHNQDWLLSRKWGLFVHYIGLCGNGTHRTDFVTYESFNERVNAFDVENFAKTVHEINAGYVFFTIMQGDKYLCAPNETYNKITGFKPGEACAERDLISDLIHALDKYDIPLMLYFTGDGPYKDELAGKAFNYYDRQKELVNSEFVEKWTAVLKEYAVRYGDKIKGWWFDGMFDVLGYTEEHIKPYADAVKAGNPDALLAFNNGVVQPDFKNPKCQKFLDGETHPMQILDRLGKYVAVGDKEAKALLEVIPGNSLRYTQYENFTAGEANAFEELPTSRFVDGSQWHILSFLGAHQHLGWCDQACGWNCLGCEYSADYMVDYVKKCNDLGGVVSIDAFLYDDGHIDWGQYEILKQIGELRK
ncbi:MAG: alpha-L-fucosidase [Clostridia bacterium]|nr:alpha-L-fucosidase [Clostridia bacterium]